MYLNIIMKENENRRYLYINKSMKFPSWASYSWFRIFFSLFLIFFFITFLSEFPRNRKRWKKGDDGNEEIDNSDGNRKAKKSLVLLSVEGKYSMSMNRDNSYYIVCIRIKKNQWLINWIHDKFIKEHQSNNNVRFFVIWWKSSFLLSSI